MTLHSGQTVVVSMALVGLLLQAGAARADHHSAAPNSAAPNSAAANGAPADSAAANGDASNSDAAEALFEAGKELMAQGRFAEACRELERSQELDPALGTLLNLADCYERRGEGARAYRTFVEVRTLAAAGGHTEVERVSANRASSLFAKLPKLTIDARAASAHPHLEVFQDDVPVASTFWGVPLPVEPGRHTFEARAPGHVPHRITVEVIPGRGPAFVEFPELVPSSGDEGGGDRRRTRTSLQPRQWFAVAAGGAGAVGLVVGTIFGIESIRAGQAADRHCDGARCRTEEGVRLRSDARSAGDVSTVGFLLGAAGVAAGAALWLTSSSEGAAGGTQVGLSADRIELRYLW